MILKPHINKKIALLELENVKLILIKLSHMF